MSFQAKEPPYAVISYRHTPSFGSVTIYDLARSGCRNPRNCSLEHTTKMAGLERHWYTVYTKPQKEDYAELNLRLRGIETFFPKLCLPKSGQRKTQIVSLFPNYLFVRFQSFEDEYYSVTWCPGVKRLVSFDSVPAAIDDSIVSFLRCQMGSDGLIAARCNVKIGQQVSIVGGPFDGLNAIVQEPPNAKGRVKILLELLNRPTKIDIPIESIKVGWIAAALKA